jgi:hypothetical protein
MRRLRHWAPSQKSGCQERNHNRFLRLNNGSALTLVTTPHGGDARIGIGVPDEGLGLSGLVVKVGARLRYALARVKADAVCQSEASLSVFEV